MLPFVVQHCATPTQQQQQQQQQHEPKHKHNLVNTQRYASMSLVQVWLSALIEFHTQNGVSKWLAGKVICNST